MAQAIVNKLLHRPTARLKEAASSGDGTLAGAAAELFGIEGEEPRAEPRRDAPADAPADGPRAAVSERS
jgi:glutamyl-tRNA reductase